MEASDAAVVARKREFSATTILEAGGSVILPSAGMEPGEMGEKSSPATATAAAVQQLLVNYYHNIFNAAVLQSPLLQLNRENLITQLALNQVRTALAAQAPTAPPREPAPTLPTPPTDASETSATNSAAIIELLLHLLKENTTPPPPPASPLAYPLAKRQKTSHQFSIENLIAKPAVGKLLDPAAKAPKHLYSALILPSAVANAAAANAASVAAAAAASATAAAAAASVKNSSSHLLTVRFGGNFCREG